MIVIKIPLPIYRNVVMCYIGGTSDDVKADAISNGIPEYKFKDWCGFECRDSIGACGNLANTRDIFIWLKKRPVGVSLTGVLVHEISHAVDKIAADTDSSMWFDSNGDSEPRAYLAEYIFTSILHGLKEQTKGA